MLFFVEDGSTRRERVRRVLDQAVLGADHPGSGPRPAFVEASAVPPGVRPATRAARRHVEALALQLRTLLADEETPDELVDLAVATAAAVDTMRTLSRRAGRQRDAGFAGAHLARTAVAALRAHATLVARPWGAPVPDVPAATLWLIADLSARLRATGREGRLGRRWDAAVEARDAADLLVTTYRCWRPRLRGGRAEEVARVAVAATQTAVWCGFASIDLEEDDGCGVPAAPSPPSPVGTTTACAAPPPPPSWVDADAAPGHRTRLQPATTR